MKNVFQEVGSNKHCPTLMIPSEKGEVFHCVQKLKKIIGETLTKAVPMKFDKSKSLTGDYRHKKTFQKLYRKK